MRISDWSSDVCSSDLASKTRNAGLTPPSGEEQPQALGQRGLHLGAVDDEVEHAVLEQELRALESLRQRLADRLLDDARSEQRRVGKVCVLYVSMLVVAETLKQKNKQNGLYQVN